MLSPLINYINDNYGSKRGFIKSIKYKLLYWIGFYRSYKNIDFSKVDRLVFVCSGNICRSPFGEYMAKSKGLNAMSYGLHTRGGDKADPRAVYEASNRGVDMVGHITRNITEYEIKNGDLFLVMEPSHLTDLLSLNIKCEQVSIAPLWSNNPTPYLSDPYNANGKFFSKCELIVEQCVDNICPKIYAQSAKNNSNRAV